LIIISNSLILFAGAILIGLEEFKLNSIIQGFFSIFQCLFQLYFTQINGFVGYIYSSLIFSLIFVIPTFYFTYKVQYAKIGKLEFSSFFDLNVIFSQLNNGISIFFSNLLVGFTQWYIMTVFKNEYSFNEVGKLNIINTIRSLLLLFPSIVYSATLPILSNLWGESEKENHNKMIDFSFHLLSKCSILLFCLLLIFSDFILQYFGHNELKIPFQLFLLATVFSAIGGTFGNALTSLGKYWFGFFINLIFAVITMISYLLLKGNGIIAVSAAYFISYFASLFYAFYLLYISNVVNKTDIFLVLKYSGLASILLLISLFIETYAIYILYILCIFLILDLFNFLRRYFFSILQ
jgi:O-antigen/teichoic acid export membrane protein